MFRLLPLVLLCAGCLRGGFQPWDSGPAPDGRVPDLDSARDAPMGDAKATPPGSLDTTFGGKGFVVLPASDGTYDGAKRVALDSQGRIVVGGQIASANPGNDIYLARLEPDGDLDTTFSGGVVVLDLNGAHEGMDGMVVDSADRIVAGGHTLVANDGAMALVRLLPDGSLDTSFAGDGQLAIQASSDTDWLRGLILDAQGRLVFSGTGQDNLTFLVGRVSAGGVPDATFGANGLAQAFSGTKSNGWDASLSPGGLPVATGRSWQGTDRENDVAVARFTTDGSPDPGFGQAGEVLLDLANHDDHAQSIVVDASGRLVVAGRTVDAAGNGQVFVLRLRADGSLDPGFGAGGTVLVAAGTDALGSTALLDSQGRVVVSGETQQPAGRDLLILRLLPDGQPDTSIGPSGYVAIDLAGGDDYTRQAVFDGQGRLLVSGWIGEGDPTDSFVARFLM